MRRIRPILAILALMAVAGAACSKDASVATDMDAVGAIAAELVRKVKAGADPSAGVADAQAYLDAHKAEIQERMARVSGVRGFQISDETKKRGMDVMMSAAGEVNTLKISLMTQTMGNEALNRSLNKLVADFNALLQGA